VTEIKPAQQASMAQIFKLTSSAIMSQAIRILIADDQELIRLGLRGLIEAEPGLEVVGEAADGAETLRKTVKLAPDVLLLDLVMPDSKGINTLVELVKVQPQTRILVLTGQVNDETIIQVLHHGAAGYLPKTVSPADLLCAIRSVATDGMPLHPHVASVIVRYLNQLPTNPAPLPQLTPRERDILELLGRGRSTKEMAKTLMISQYTVRSHISSLLKKLQLTSRTQAALYMAKQGVPNAHEP
jgi:NarL family two-component system response regulator LiaR